MLGILLQVSTQLTPDTTGTNIAKPQLTDQSISMLDLLAKGGPVMIPIGILFVLAVYLFLERYFYIQKTSKMDGNFLYTIREMLFNGNIKGAIDYCKMSQMPIARLLEKGLNRIGQPIRDIEGAIENTARVEIYNMEKNTDLLGAIAAIAPMFGFLGTVAGLILTLHDIAARNDVNIGIISAGIYQKMITSATGLIVGILAHIFYTILMSMINRSINKMEVTAIDFMDILYKPAK